jgi:hypothetical protein
MALPGFPYQQNDLNAYRINAFTVTLPNDTCFQPFGGG